MTIPAEVEHLVSKIYDTAKKEALANLTSLPEFWQEVDKKVQEEMNSLAFFFTKGPDDLALYVHSMRESEASVTIDFTEMVEEEAKEGDEHVVFVIAALEKAIVTLRDAHDARMWR